MVRWIAVPICPICEEQMEEDSDGDYECAECGNLIYAEELED